MFDHIAVKETLDRAAELIGYGEDLPDDEAIGFSCGWWPSFASNAGAYIQLNPDGSGTIVTGAQENGTGAVMAMPAYVAEVLGMEPGDFQLLYQDTDAAPWDMGSAGSQTTFNAVRAVLDAADDVREQLLDAAGDAGGREGRPGTRRGRGAREGLARALGHVAEIASVRHDPRQGRGPVRRTRRRSTRRRASGGSASSRSWRRSCSPTPPT